MSLRTLEPLAVPLAAGVVEASAGTGKTHTLASLYVRLLVEQRLSPAQVLVVTFTNAATAELRDRLRRRLRGARDVLAGAASDDPFLQGLKAARPAPLEDARWLTEALRDFDEAAISTIHGFCQRVLARQAFEGGVPFDVELVADRQPYVEDLATDFWARRFYHAPRALLEQVKAEGIDLALLSRIADRATAERGLPVIPGAGEVATDPVTGLLGELVEEARRELPQRLAAAHAQSFDDLVHRLDEALAGPRGGDLAQALRGSYRAALVDESQDTDAVQHRIFARIFAGAPLFLIGDPKQAIYSFRGADVGAYLDAARALGDARFTLATNYRSDAGLVRALNALFLRGGSRPFLQEGIDYVPVSAARGGPSALEVPRDPTRAIPFRVLFARRPPKAPGARKGRDYITKGEGNPLAREGTAADIARLLASGATLHGRPVHAGDIAVLTRKNAEAEELQRSLTTYGIPSVLQTDASVFESPEASHLEQLLVAALEPARGSAVRAALATPLFGLTSDDLLDLDEREDLWEERAMALRGLADDWQVRGFLPAFRRFLERQGIVPRLLGQQGGERQLTNLLHVAELLEEAARAQHLGPAGLAAWLGHTRRTGNAREIAREAALVRLESDESAVKLVTIHKSKGLEYPIVYCPFLWDGRLASREKRLLLVHDPAQGGQRVLDLRAPADKAAALKRAEAETAAENARLLYVALTRARHQVNVVWGRFNEGETSALGYLLHGPPVATAAVREDDPDLGERRFAATKERIKGLSDEAMEEDLAGLARAAEGAVAVTLLDPTRGPRYVPPRAPADDLRGRTFTRALRGSFRSSSFSALTRSGTVSDGAAEEDEPRDRDEADEDAREEASTSPRVTASPATVLLADFPAGPRAGDVLHRILEGTDLAGLGVDGARGRLAERVGAELRRGGYPEDRWRETVARAVEGVATTPLAEDDPSFTLASIPARAHTAEMEFTLPVALSPPGAPSPAAVELVTARRLAASLRSAGGPVAKGYAEALGRLPFPPLEGYLRGFMDAVVVHRGRFYVIDYKSNHLGNTLADYATARLGAPMVEHHYVLQYHLYAVALHRHLTRRLPGYEHARHFGGVLYLFLRGMVGADGAGHGVFRDRPSRALLEGLSAVLDGRGPRRGT